jgi:phosphoglycerol transferase MdoB-like AlkP superfamily enzyme
MPAPDRSARGVLPGVIVFWWGLFFLAQTAERIFLMREAARLEPPASGVLLTTVLTGARADFIVSSLGVMVALLGAGLVALPLTLSPAWRAWCRAVGLFRRAFTAVSGTLAVLGGLLLTVDMAYYGYNHHHLDAVFFDYVDELVSRAPADTTAAPGLGASRQAVEQTRAEMSDTGKWARRLGAFAVLQAVVIAAWRWLFHRRIRPALRRWAADVPRASVAALGLCLAAGVTGLDIQGPFVIARAGIRSTTYYALAQNPVWQSVDAFFLAFGSNQRDTRERAERLMPLDEAIRLTRQTVGPAAVFPFPGYPLVQRVEGPSGPSTPRRLNVLVVFAEALDRRFTGPALTPFLERWSRDAVVFENFFANGQLTHHGLFSSLCSHLSGFGKSPIKVRYTHDYLCLPALMQRAGYWTEMVIGYNRDHHQDHTALFLARNGVRHFVDEGNFPAGAERLGLGVTDGALFDEVRRRIEALRRAPQPFFLATLTLSTHHPFTVPLLRPDVAALAEATDRYPATLRYFDAELERFFTGLVRDGLLEDTLVFVLGDHGRHEVIGKTDDELWLGHHLTPLYVWLPPALRPAIGFRPRRVDTVASQVDLTPTVLALTGLLPPVAPFVGKDLSCVLGSDCRPDNQAALLTSHSAALVRNNRILAYGLKSGLLREMDLALRNSRDVDAASAPDAAAQLRRLKALIVASALLVDQNRVWSWAELGPVLATSPAARVRDRD